SSSRNRTKVTRELLVSTDDIIAQLRVDIERGREYASDLFATLITVLDNYNEEASAYDLRQRITESVRRHPIWSQVEIIWDNLLMRLKQVEDGLSRISTALGEPDWDMMPHQPEGNAPSYADLLLELRNDI